MVREKWADIAALYKTYLGVIEPLLKETLVIVRETDANDLMKPEVINSILEHETKRKLKRVKVIAEFNAFFRGEIFRYISDYIDEVRDILDPEEIKDYIIDFIIKAIKAINVLMDMVVEDQMESRGSLLYKLVHTIAEILIPEGKSLAEIYDKLIERSVEWYEAQRYILRPSTYYREKIDEMEIPGLSPTMYQILNQITSLFNLEPSYLDMPEDPNIVIPGIMKNDVFEPFIKNLAKEEEEALARILQRIEMRLLHNIFIAPTKRFIDLTEPHKYFSKQTDVDGKIRYIPQFSNETLILLYLAQVSYRRGFLDKELVNWIAMNFAFIIYMAVLNAVLEDENIFIGLFLDLKTEEKILPYLMKLICFPDYLRIDRAKIRDSPVYRKELFIFLGNKIEVLDYLVDYIKDEVLSILKEESGE